MPGFKASTADIDPTMLEKLLSGMARQQAHLEVILACMSQGIALFDVDCRLVVSNRRYLNIYGVREELGAPGTTLEEILQYRVEAGAYSEAEQNGFSDRYRAMARGSVSSPQLFRLRDDRMISVNCHALEGGGWLSTHDDVTELWTLQREVEHMAYHDQLTGLGNRRLLEKRLQSASKEADEDQGAILVLIDLDGFKAINDELGHLAGDRLLQAVADRLQAEAEGAFVSRLGGDEFAVLLPARKREDMNCEFTRRLIEKLHAPYRIDGQDLRCGASAGMAMLEAGACDTDRVIGMADRALYASKKRGKGCATFSDLST